VASVDTNVLLRWLLGDVPKQAERVDQLIASGTTLLVEDAALIEVVFVLERVMLLSRASVAQAIATIISTAAFDLDRESWRTVSADYVAHPKLSVADVYLARRAVKQGATPLYTSDRKVASQLADTELL
jgi:predicted nucleic-acid-binding protein